MGTSDRRAEGVAARGRRRRGRGATPAGRSSSARRPPSRRSAATPAALALLALEPVAGGAPRRRVAARARRLPPRCRRRAGLCRRRVMQSASQKQSSRSSSPSRIGTEYLEDVVCRGHGARAAPARGPASGSSVPLPLRSRVAAAARDGGVARASRPRPARTAGWNASVIVCSGFASSSMLVEALEQLLEERGAASPPRPSRAPGRSGSRRSRHAARSPVAARATAPPAARSARPAARISGPTFRCFATGRYGFSRPSASASSISPARCSIRTWKCRWPGSTREPGRELAVRQRPVRLAEHLQHLQSQRMAERLQLLGPVDLEDVVRLWLASRGCSWLQSAPCGLVEEDLDANRGEAGEARRARPR